MKRNLEIKGKHFIREMLPEPIQREAGGDDDRIFTLSFASDAPVDRGGYIEVLNMDGMRTERLKRKAGVFLNHDKDRQIGASWGDPWLKAEGGLRKAYSKVKLSRNPLGDEVKRDIEDGILENVSFGYIVNDYRIDELPDGKFRVEITDFTPWEISIENKPADVNVGIGRSFETAIEEKLKNKEDEKMRRTAAEGIQTPVQQTPVLPVEGARVDAVAAERERIDAILKIGDSFGLQDMAREAILDKAMTVEVFQTRVLNTIRAGAPTIQPQRNDVGMTQREQRTFSLDKVMTALEKQRTLDGYEAEVCAEAARMVPHRQVTGLMIPFSALSGQRDASPVNTQTIGSTIETSVQGSNFIEVLRKRTIADRLGVDLSAGNIGNFTMPKGTVGSSYFWVGEDEDLQNSRFETGFVGFSPKTVGSIVPISRRAQLQNSVNLETRIRNDMAKAIAEAIDDTLFNGSGAMNADGTAQVVPKGLLTYAAAPKSAVRVINSGDNGGSIGWNHVIAMETEISAATADLGSMAYVTNSRVRGYLKSTPKIENAAAGWIWETGMNGEGLINGYRAMISEFIPSNLTKGNGKNLSAIILGCWNQAHVAFWGPGVEVQLNPYSKNGSISLRVLLDMDVNFKNLESFAVLTGVDTNTGDLVRIAADTEGGTERGSIARRGRRDE